ncbi:MAG: ferritin-like domain-containing protein [Actinomycetota bacterium]|nr:ferritin-like domain-containing protein [Actinomycetota bacterium]
MRTSDLAVPELAAIDVQGMTRGAFIVRGALAAGAVYGGAAVGPFVGQALAQASGDVDVLNFALTLEFLEAEFYKQALKEVDDLDSEVKELAEEIEKNEAEHVDTLTQTIEQLGGKPTKAPEVDFGDAFRSQDAFLKLALTFEDTGVSAYNGAAPRIKSEEVLGAAGAIVQVEARHAALIAHHTNGKIAPSGAFDKPLGQEKVLKAVEPFVKS